MSGATPVETVETNPTPAVFVLLELLFYVGNRRGSVAFYDDHVEFDGETLDYADVSAAVHGQSFAHGLFDTADGLGDIDAGGGFDGGGGAA